MGVFATLKPFVPQVRATHLIQLKAIQLKWLTAEIVTRAVWILAKETDHDG